MSVKDLHEKALVGEAKAILRLKLFAEKADKEGYSQIAKLFRVISFSEEIHATRNIKMLKEIKSTEENLKDSFQSEMKVAKVSYNNYIKTANNEGEKLSAKIFTQSKDVETYHAKLYQKALNHMAEEKETTYYVCKECGYVSDTYLPEKCPVCNVDKAHFISF